MRAITVSIALAALVVAPVAAQSPTPEPIPTRPPVEVCVRLTVPEGTSPSNLWRATFIEVIPCPVTEPEPTVEPQPTASSRPGAYDQFLDRQARTVGRLSRLARALDKDGDRADVRRIRDLMRRERAWLDSHEPNPCFLAGWTYYHGAVTQAYETARDVYRASRSGGPLPPFMEVKVDFVLLVKDLGKAHDCE